MKLVKMSLATAVLLGASAFALDNVKVSGDAKLFYSAQSSEYDVDPVNQPGVKASGLFDQGSSVGDAALRVSVTGDLVKNVSFGATGYAVSSLGLENNLVANTWAGSRTGTQDSAWMGELWIAGTAGKTTAKVGRMELDTPLVFSEKWSIVPNTFNAAVLMNQDLPDTTLVGAWIGQGNGLNVSGTHDNNNTAGWDYMGNQFTTFADSGAYAVGAINNSFKPLVAQAWYYNVANVADAYWLQADWACQLIKDVKIGVQYANMDPKGILGTDMKDSDAYAVKVAYEGIDKLVLSAAYSSADKDNGDLRIANVATDNNGHYNSSKFDAQSKLYTEAWWNYGYVGAAGADTVTLAAAYDAGFAKLYAQYTDISIQTTAGTTDVVEGTLTATRSYGPLDATLAYIYADDTSVNNAKSYDTVQAYLTLNF